MIDFSIRESSETGLVEIINNGDDFNFQKIIVEIDNQKIVIDNETNPVLADFLLNNAQLWVKLAKANVYEVTVNYLEQLDSTVTVHENLLSYPEIYNNTLNSDTISVNDKFFKIEKSKSSQHCLFLSGLIGDDVDCIYKVIKVKKEFCYLYPIKRILTKQVLKRCQNADTLRLFTCIDLIEDEYALITFDEKRKIVNYMLSLL